MKFIPLLACIVLLSSCSKTSEFAIPTSAYFKIPATSSVYSKTIINIDSIPTNFTYSFQANETSPGNVKQLLFEQVNFTIINNNYAQTFNFIDTLRIALVTGEKTTDTVAYYAAPITAIGSTTLQLASGVDASRLMNSSFYNLTATFTCTDSIPEDVQIQANILFYVKAKTD